MDHGGKEVIISGSHFNVFVVVVVVEQTVHIIIVCGVVFFLVVDIECI